jgi:hypothetical protein
MQPLYCAGEEEMVQEFTTTGLLPDTEEFITYEGSLTQPPCQVYSLTCPRFSTVALFLVPDRGMSREIREGWPLLTVETEVNGDSKSKSKGSYLGWYVGPVVPVQS